MSGPCRAVLRFPCCLPARGGLPGWISLLGILALLACGPQPGAEPGGSGGEARADAGGGAGGEGGAAGGIPQFDAVQAELFVDGGALVNAWADVDGDGDLDLFVGFGSGPSRLYINVDGAFREAAGEWGLTGDRGVRGGGWGDFDGDGRPDLLVGHVPGEGPVLRLLRNDGGSLSDRTVEAGLVVEEGAVRQISWVDFDADGDLDLFVAFRDRPNALFRNSGGRFTDVAPELGVDDPRRTVGAVWLDADGDGHLDLLVGNMDGDANGLFRYDGTRFVDVAEAAGVAWGGRLPGDATNGTVRPCAADVDGDGLLDLFFANYGANGLFLNRGGGRFEDVSQVWGVDGDSRDDSCAFADFDHDGRLDLYVNGTVTGGVSHPDRLYRNTGSRFVEVTPPAIAALHASHGVQWADFDGDGALDLALSGTRDDATHSLFRNGLPAHIAARSLQVALVDGSGVARFPGTLVRLLDPGTSRVLATRMVDSGSGYNSQGVLPLHFGLATEARVDLEVLVPGSGVVRVLDLGPSREVVVLRIAADGSVGVDR